MTRKLLLFGIVIGVLDFLTPAYADTIETWNFQILGTPDLLFTLESEKGRATLFELPPQGICRVEAITS